MDFYSAITVLFGVRLNKSNIRTRHVKIETVAVCHSKVLGSYEKHEHRTSLSGFWQCLINPVMPSPVPLASLGEHWAAENSLLKLAGQATSVGWWEREASAFFVLIKLNAVSPAVRSNFQPFGKIKPSLCLAASAGLRLPGLVVGKHTGGSVQVGLVLGQTLKRSGGPRMLS